MKRVIQDLRGYRGDSEQGPFTFVIGTQDPYAILYELYREEVVENTMDAYYETENRIDDAASARWALSGQSPQKQPKMTELQFYGWLTHRPTRPSRADVIGLKKQWLGGNNLEWWYDEYTRQQREYEEEQAEAAREQREAERAQREAERAAKREAERERLAAQTPPKPIPPKKKGKPPVQITTLGEIAAKTPPFCDPKKLKAIGWVEAANEPKTVAELATATFNVKDNRRYQLHHVHALNTWMMDLMFAEKLTYLLLVHANSRYLFVQPTNTILADNEGIITFGRGDTKSEKSIMQALDEILKRMPIEKRPISLGGSVLKLHIRGDGETGFAGKVAQQFYKNRGIEFVAARRLPADRVAGFSSKSQLNHTSLAVLDRVVRSIRDIAFRGKILLTPQGIARVAEMYNTVPNIGLSKIAGFDVSPQLAFSDEALELAIARQVQTANAEIMSRSGFMLPIGSKVVLYNSVDGLNKRRAQVRPRLYEVVGHHGALHEIKGEGQPNSFLVSRCQIRPY
jgi:hypothetical protein